MTLVSPDPLPTRGRITALQDELARLHEQLIQEGAVRTDSLPETLSLLLVTCGPLGVAISALKAIEVLPRVAFDALPEPLRNVLGVMRYRGALVPIIDLCARLGSRNSTPLLAQRIIIVEGNAGLRGLLVGEAVEVMATKRSDMTPLPHDISLGHLGVAKVRSGDRVFTLLDLDVLLSEVPDLP